MLYAKFRTWDRLVLAWLLPAVILAARACGGWEQGVIAGEASSIRETGTAAALKFSGRADAEGFPPEFAWEKAPAIEFRHDWQGKNPDPGRATEVRMLWTDAVLYLRFESHYLGITVFDDAEPDGRRDRLWERDVAEVFLQPADSEQRSYKEIEVSPNGFWIDLDIAPGGKHDLRSGMKRRVRVDERNRIWRAELAVPMKCLTGKFDPAVPWRVNFYRVEGAQEPRFYSAWQPTGTPEPNFHVPEAFGKLVFER